MGVEHPLAILRAGRGTHHQEPQGQDHARGKEGASDAQVGRCAPHVEEEYKLREFLGLFSLIPVGGVSMTPSGMAPCRLLLSGTPVQNHVLELWSLFDFLMPGFLGTEREFNAKYGKAVQVRQQSQP